MSRRDAGFSLLELLVAGVLAAMVVATASGSLRFGARVWERTAAGAEATLEARAVRRFLTALLEGAAPLRLRDGARAAPALFFGEPDALVFAAPLPGRLAPPGLHLLRLAVEQGEGRDDAALVLRWKPLGATRPDLAFDAADPAETLLAGVAGARFAYVGDRREDRWRAETPPRLVEIDLPGAPPIVVAPRAAP